MSYGKPRGKLSHEMAKSSYTQKSQQQQPIPPPSGSEPGRTSYWSANNEDRSTFFADAPANSQHATRLMKIAMQNQPRYGKAEKTHQKRLDGKGQQQQQQRQLGNITKSPSRSLATTTTTTTISPDEDDEDDESNSQAYPPLSSYPYTHSPSSSSSQIIQPSHHHHHHSPPQLPEVYRYEIDGKVTYRQIATGGELKISAPLGSQEAREMEYAASKLCKPQQRQRQRGCQCEGGGYVSSSSNSV